jgi:hypothetical protein
MNAAGAVLSRRQTVILTHSGRLGNQIFQYAALRAFVTTDGPRLVLVDYDDLARTFTGVRARFLSTRRPADRLRLWMTYRRRHLTGEGLGLIRPDPHSGLPCLIRSGQVIDAIGYYQMEASSILSAARELEFAADVESEAVAAWQGWFGASEAPVAFVAIRRGDYLTHRVGFRAGGELGWVEDGSPVALDLDWYVRGMEELRALHRGIRFLVVTDDPAWCRRSLAGPDVVVSGRSPSVDLALMARCDAGVLSPSSLAWWGARFASDRSAGPFLAPEHWLGHRIGHWWPSTIAASHLTYRSAR